MTVTFPHSKASDLRFRDPIKNEPWTGILNAVPPKSQCIQLDLIRSFEAHGVKKTLYLNVYTPQNYKGKRLPVIV